MRGPRRSRGSPRGPEPSPRPSAGPNGLPRVESPALTGGLVAAALVAFAANSLLCRIALGLDLIDPLSFTTIRLISGALTLASLSRLTRTARAAGVGDSKNAWGRTVALFAYALAFSLAYVSLETGTGALVLFGAVQATMIGSGLRVGERPKPTEWAGLGLAIAGLAYLTLPGATAPDPIGVALMLTAGVAWGVYSLLGRGVRAPVASTTTSFTRASPLALAVSVAGLGTLHLDLGGLVLAIGSGAVTSGLGYVLWYRALRGLTGTRAAIVQLVVPVLAAFGGIVVLDERVSLRLLVASTMILGGVAIALSSRDATLSSPRP